MIMKDFGLYIVMTAPELGYRRFTEICVQEEVPILQLREKEMSNLELIALARELAAICAGSNTRFIINDRADLCRLADADGLHLGPTDMPWQKARPLLPENKVIGVSTHSIAAAKHLISVIQKGGDLKAPDYMSFGPIYPTVAKKVPDPPVGTSDLRKVIEIAPIPVVAIGGIFPHNTREVCATGAKNISMIRHFGSSLNKAELVGKILEFKQLLKENSR